MNEIIILFGAITLIMGLTVMLNELWYISILGLIIFFMGILMFGMGLHNE